MSVLILAKSMLKRVILRLYCHGVIRATTAQRWIDRLGLRLA